MTVAFPTLAYNVGFANAPMDVAPTWVDLFRDVETLTVTRGRQTEDDEAQTGTCAAILGDTNRSYDPNNAAGAHYPNVQPMKPVQVVFTLLGTPFKMHTGWVDIQDGWVRDESDPGKATVYVPSNDAFELLATGRVVGWVGNPRDTSFGVLTGAAFNQEATGDRIKHILAGHFGYVDPDGNNIYYGMDPAWPWSTAGIATGLALMQSIPTPSTTADSTPLGLVRDAEVTEPGLLVFDGDGLPLFFDRQYRQTAVSSATFCDSRNISAGRVPYKSVTTRRSSVVTDSRTTRDGGTLQQLDNEPGIASLWRRVRSWSTKHLDDATAALYNQFQLNARKDSYELLESLTLVPGTDYDTWLQILTRDVGDRITVVRTPQGTGTAITEDYYIEGLTFTWGPGASASCTWRLSSAAAYQGWQAGQVGASEAGSTTKAGW